MPKFCPNCGNPLNEGVKFCTKCGTPVAAMEAPQQPVQEQTSSFKPVFTETEVNDTVRSQEPVYSEPAVEHEPFVQPIYNEPVQTAETAPETVKDYINVDNQQVTGKAKKEKKYFGFKNILLFLLNAGMIALFFFGGLFINIDPMKGFEGMEDGANIALSFGKGFLYLLQAAFGFGSFNTGVELVDQSLAESTQMMLEGADPAMASIANIVKIAGLVGMGFVLLAAIAAIVSLIRIFIRKRGVSGNIFSIFSSLYGLILGGGLVAAVLLFKDKLLGMIDVAEGYELMPLNFGIDPLGFAFVGVALLTLIIAIVTIKK